MKVAVSHEGAATIVKPEGPLTESELHELDRRLRELADNWTQRIVVNLSEAALIDSAGLELLCQYQHELQQHGIKVPEDVAVIGFNNIAPGKISTPALATGDRKPEEMAEKLEEMLMRRIKQPDLPPQRETVHMEFIWRESAGPKIG